MINAIAINAKVDRTYIAWNEPLNASLGSRLDKLDLEVEDSISNAGDDCILPLESF